MQAWIALIALGWLVSNPWALAVIAVLGLAVVGFFVWDARKGTIDLAGLSLQSARRSRRALAARVDELSTALRSAQSEIESLRLINSELQKQARAMQRQERSPEQALFRRVGLHSDAPDWVVAAVQRAYRAKLHPDRYPPRLQEAAKRRFQEAEAVFDRIGQERARAAA